MRQAGCVVAALAAALWAGSAPALAALHVEPDKENVVASRLEGTWRPHVDLTKRLTGRAPAPRGESPTGVLTFKGEPAVAGKIPAKYEPRLAELRIYMAGHMILRDKVHPFILIVHGGNPHIVWFREHDGDPMGDAESFIVMLAGARDKANDLLFVGGDFARVPFAAYQRFPEPGAAVPPQAQPVAALLKAVKDGDLDAFKAVWSRSLRGELGKRGWQAAFDEYRRGFKEHFGDYDLGDFAYDFDGDERSGTVRVVRRDHLLPGLAVVKEDDGWKINEH